MNIKIRQFKRGEQVAPHKPLLLLIAIARLQSGEPRLLTYQEIEPSMNELLLKYTKSKGKPHPEFPFWRLRNDMNGELWEIPSAPSITQNDHGDVSPRHLIALKIKAGFTLTVFEQLKNDPVVAAVSRQRKLVQKVGSSPIKNGPSFSFRGRKSAPGCGADRGGLVGSRES